MPNERRRRTERLFLRYPLDVKGKDADGSSFAETTHTIVVNRHGARIFLKTQVAAGSTLKITQVMSGCSGDFRVVGLAGTRSEAGGEWGVECLDEALNFWGINFPSIDEPPAAASVLLECSGCHEIALTIITMVDYDLLENNGSLLKECKTCNASTKCIYATTPAAIPIPTAAGAPAVAAASPQSATPAVAPQPSGADRRTSKRVALRLPIRVRGDAPEFTELTKSENVSKGGLAFTSGRVLEIDTQLLVACPYNPDGENIEIRCRVARREDVAGTGRYLYGVEYLR